MATKRTHSVMITHMCFFAILLHCPACADFSPCCNQSRPKNRHQQSDSDIQNTEDGSAFRVWPWIVAVGLLFVLAFSCVGTTPTQLSNSKLWVPKLIHYGAPPLSSAVREMTLTPSMLRRPVSCAHILHMRVRPQKSKHMLWLSTLLVSSNAPLDTAFIPRRDYAWWPPIDRWNLPRSSRRFRVGIE